MKYKKGEKVIEASKKAYRVIYKAQGYVPTEETDKNEEAEKENKGENELLYTGKKLEELNATGLKKLAKEKGIEGYSSLSKDELLAVLKGVV